MGASARQEITGTIANADSASAKANAALVDFGITPVEPATKVARIGPIIWPSEALKVYLPKYSSYLSVGLLSATIVCPPTMHAKCASPESAAPIATTIRESATIRDTAETPIKKVPIMTKRPSPTRPTKRPKVSANKTGKRA